MSGWTDSTKMRDNIWSMLSWAPRRESRQDEREMMMRMSTPTRLCGRKPAPVRTPPVPVRLVSACVPMLSFERMYVTWHCILNLPLAWVPRSQPCRLSTRLRYYNILHSQPSPATFKGTCTNFPGTTYHDVVQNAVYRLSPFIRSVSGLPETKWDLHGTFSLPATAPMDRPTQVIHTCFRNSSALSMHWEASVAAPLQSTDLHLSASALHTIPPDSPVARQLSKPGLPPSMAVAPVFAWTFPMTRLYSPLSTPHHRFPLSHMVTHAFTLAPTGTD
jgi:hypothetical protein